MTIKTKFAVTAAMSVLSLSFLAHAQPPSGSRGERRGPPPEAVDACSGASEAQACTFESPHGTVEGTCRKPPQADELACVPNDHCGGPPPQDD